MNKQILTLLALITLAKFELPFPWKISKLKQPTCGLYSMQLTSLFTFVCNNIAFGEENVLRDACVGCFQAASVARNNQPSLAELSNCAQTYFGDTRYEGCSNLIEISTPLTENGCVTGYCRFIQCIRKVNSDLLIAQCYEQASVDNDALFEADQIILVKNITSCILARARCASRNPITGQQQTNRINKTTFDKWGKPRTSSIPLYNSLQITPAGDLRIVSLPGTIKIQIYFCTPQPNLQESSWLEFSC